MRSLLKNTITVLSLILAGFLSLAQTQVPPQGAPLPTITLPAEPAAAAPAKYSAAELDRVISPIALYPDPLLAQVLAAATYSDQIPAAAQWSDLHHYLSGATLTAAMAADQVPWDPSVQALLPFPSVLDMMSSDLPWTEEIGSAFLLQREDVMDAVQRMRQKAVSFRYLMSGPQVLVRTGRYIEVVPVNPDFIVVPYYDPAVVFVAPRYGAVIAGSIVFGHGVSLGVAFADWGWRSNRFVWDQHTVIINNSPWQRTWENRATYAHPYRVPRYTGPRPVDSHRPIERSPRERQDERFGRGHAEEQRP